mgnify:CR=1 FL=1
MGSSYIEGDDFTVEFDHCCDLSFIFLPLISFLLNLSLLFFELLLHISLESLQEVVVCQQLVSDPVELGRPILEQIINPGNMVGKDLLKLLDARSPDAFHFTHSADAIDLDCLR